MSVLDAKLPDTIRKIRAFLNSRNISMEGILNTLSPHDTNHTGSLPRPEFECQMLGMFGSYLSRAEIASIARAFPAGDGVDYSGFSRHISGGLSERRRAIIRTAFDRVRNGREFVSMQTLLSNFNARRHPRVEAEEFTVQQCIDHFKHAMRDAGFLADGRVYAAEFEEYYCDLAAREPSSDDYFVYMIECVWSVKEHAPQARGASSERVVELLQLIREKLRAKCRHEDRERKMIAEAFHFADLNGDGYLSLPVWSRIFRDYHFSQADVELLFSHFAEGADMVEYSRVFTELFPPRLYAR